MPDFSSRRRQGETNVSDVILLAIGFVFLVLSCYGASDAWAERNHAQAALEQARRESDLLGSRERALRPERSEGDQSAAQAALTADAPPPRVLGDLTALLPPSVRLTSVSLGYGARLELDLRVSARDAAGYDLFLKRLGESKRFTAIAPGPENRVGEVTASLQVVYREADAP
jgi:hypothetical protein